jgi:hypothetical protein
MPEIYKMIPVPPHYQDVDLHCGQACATMMLDWLRGGNVFQLDPNQSDGPISQFKMHSTVVRQNLGAGVPYGTAPQELQWEVNGGTGSPVAGSPATSRAILHSLPDGTLNPAAQLLPMIEHSVLDGRPVVVLQKDEAGHSSHWVVVHGLTRSGLLTTGFLIRDPWVMSEQWAYDHEGPKAPCWVVGCSTEGHFFQHTRGHCACPHWTQASVPPHLFHEWSSVLSGVQLPAGLVGSPVYATSDMHRRIDLVTTRGDAANEGGSHAVFYGRPDQYEADKRHVMPLPLARVWPKLQRADFSPQSRKVKSFVDVLVQAGLVGQDSPPGWPQAIDELRASPPTVLPMNHGGHLVVWADGVGQGTDDPSLADSEKPPLASAAKRCLGVLFDDEGDLRRAAQLQNWPLMLDPDSFQVFFSQNGEALCRKLDPNMSFKGVAVSVAPTLHWESCDQSVAPWWPFYEVTLTWQGRPSVRLYVDPAGRVFGKLILSRKRGA